MAPRHVPLLATLSQARDAEAAKKLEAAVRQVRQEALQHALRFGVGFMYDSMAPSDREIVRRLLKEGAI